MVTLNPAARLGRLLRSCKDRRAHIEPLTRQEVQTVLKAAEDRFKPLYPILLCAVRTGLRLGELIGLQWGDVDFRGSFLEVRRSVVLSQETTTKSHKIRRVDMSPQLKGVLQELKEVRQLEAMNKGQALHSLVFLSPAGCLWDDRNLRRGYYRCLEVAGIRQVRFHDLRHTYASLLIEQGATPKYIQEQMGHSSIQVTMDVYGHLFPSSNREWAGKLDESGWEPKSATQPQPELTPLEQVTHKPLENIGGDGRDRTADPRLMSPLLYQLIYIATKAGIIT
jgi:integrase